eukprot:4616733-Alexandrium_andersonii.AAC.1
MQLRVDRNAWFQVLSRRVVCEVCAPARDCAVLRVGHTGVVMGLRVAIRTNWRGGRCHQWGCSVCGPPACAR